MKWWTRPEAKHHQMLLFPRDHLKSTLVAYRCAWEITRNPSVTILYISATSNLAEKQLGFIKDILDSPRYRRFWPEMVNPEEARRKRWTQSEIMVDHPKREEEGVRDPTIFTAGLTTTITGLHCDIAVLDDIVVNENAYTEEGRNKVATQYSLLSSIETSESREWIVGTRYHPKDLYGTLIELTHDVVDEEGEVVDSAPVYEVYQREVEDMGDGSGTYLWPRQQRGDGRWFGFNQKILAVKRAKYLDRTQFYAQYYNNPNSTAEQAIDSSLFQYYNRQFLVQHQGRWTYNGNVLNVFAAIDFAFSLQKRADYTALVVIGMDHSGNIYVLDCRRIKTNKVDEFYDLVRTTHLKWGYKKLRAEVTGGQVIVAERIRDEIRREGLILSVDDFRPTRYMGTKEERIDAELRPRYENRSIWHYPGGLCEDLEQELIMQKPPNDDLKDALANCVAIAKPPIMANKYRTRTNVVTHSRFGGVSM